MIKINLGAAKKLGRAGFLKKFLEAHPAHEKEILQIADELFKPKKKKAQ